MKKLIALFAVTTLASTGALASVAITGSASVSYDDNGSTGGDSTTTYDADLVITGTAGSTTVTIGADIDSDWSHSSTALASTIGPVTIAADMFNTTPTMSDDGTGDPKSNTDDRSVTVSLDVPVGDATVGLTDDGDVVLSGTFSGVTITHTVQAGEDKSVASASIAGMDITLTNSAGATTWSIGTTVSGVDLTLDSENDVTAAFGLAGNTLTVTHVGARALVAATTTAYSTSAADAYTTAAVSRDLTSGATLTATYSSLDDSLTLKAAVTF
jgi:hypothetical protein